MPMHDVSAQMLEVLLAIARAAGDTVLELYGVALAVDYKAYREPVTAADQRSNRPPVDRLNAAFSGIPERMAKSEPNSRPKIRLNEVLAVRLARDIDATNANRPCRGRLRRYADRRGPRLDAHEA